VTAKELPLASADGVASVTPPCDTIVSDAAPESPMAAPFTVSLLNVTVPKFDSGSTVPSLGASAMISADPSCASALVCCVVCVQP
jgi:hypothetical protein